MKYSNIYNQNDSSKPLRLLLEDQQLFNKNSQEARNCKKWDTENFCINII